MSGWFKIQRDLGEHWIWNDKPYSKGQAWIDLIMHARHQKEPQEILIKGRIYKIEYGQQARSELTLAKKWGWSRGKLRRFLSCLENEQMLVQHPDNKTSIITIINYKKYQEEETALGTALGTTHGTPTVQHPDSTRYTKEEGKKERRKEEFKKEKVKKEKIETGGEKPKKENEIHKEVISYLNEKAGKNFKSTTDATKKLINGRVSEGYSLEDFKRVIDTKTAKWKGHPKWDNFLRPQTLFRPSNFESYLNETAPPINDHASRQGLLPSLGNVQNRHQNEAPRATTVHQALILQREETAERILQARAARRIKNEE